MYTLSYATAAAVHGYRLGVVLGNDVADARIRDGAGLEGAHQLQILVQLNGRIAIQVHLGNQLANLLLRQVFVNTLEDPAQFFARNVAVVVSIEALCTGPLSGCGESRDRAICAGPRAWRNAAYRTRSSARPAHRQ